MLFLITRKSPTKFSLEGHASNFIAQFVLMHDRSLIKQRFSINGKADDTVRRLPVLV